MQTVNENIPVTKVVKVSELRTVDYISDNAMFICVQNGKSLKTTYGALKDILLKQVLKDVQQKLSYQADLEQAALSATDELLKVSTKALSSSIAENIIKTDNAANAVENLSTQLDKINDHVVKQFSTVFGSCQKIANTVEQISAKYSTLPSNVDYKLENNNKQLIQKLEQYKANISKTIDTIEADYKNNFYNLSANFEKDNKDLSSNLNSYKQQLDEAISAFNSSIDSIKKSIIEQIESSHTRFINVEKNVEENSNNTKRMANSNAEQFSSLSNKITATAAQVRVMSEQLSEAKEQIKILVKENSELREKLDYLISYNEDSYCATVNEGDSK